MFSIKSRIINNMGFAGCVWSLSHIVILFFFFFTVLYSVCFFFLNTNLWEIVKDREAWRTAAHGSQRVGHDLVTEQQQ